MTDNKDGTSPLTALDEFLNSLPLSEQTKLAMVMMDKRERELMNAALPRPIQGHVDKGQPGAAILQTLPDEMHTYRLLLEVRASVAFRLLPKALRNEILSITGESQ